MSAEIVPLTAAYRSNEPEPTVVEMLEELLDQARRGEIAGLAAAWVNSNGGTTTNWASGRAEAAHMLASVTRLWRQVVQADSYSGIDIPG